MKKGLLFLSPPYRVIVATPDLPNPQRLTKDQSNKKRMVTIELMHAMMNNRSHGCFEQKVRAKIGQLGSDHSASPYPDPDLMSCKFSSPGSAAACLSCHILEHSASWPGK